jgi:hypothetical protein
MDRRQRGRKGGKETLKRYGVQHFRELGRRGIRALADRYFHGSIADAMAWLRKRASELGIARGVQEKLDKQIANGAQTASEEIPVILTPDEDLSYWQELVHAGKRHERESEIPF